VHRALNRELQLPVGCRAVDLRLAEEGRDPLWRCFCELLREASRTAQATHQLDLATVLHRLAQEYRAETDRLLDGRKA
jgi:hypothetical protein